jgi:hypothetical protein
MSDRSHFETFPPQLLGRRFVSEDGRLYFVVRAAGVEADAERFPLRVEVGREDGAAMYAAGAYAQWIPRKDESSQSAFDRLDRVVVELGSPLAGPTYSLMFTRPAEAPGFSFVALRPDTPPERIAVFPQHGWSPYYAADDEWAPSAHWWSPYSTFRLASEPKTKS